MEGTGPFYSALKVMESALEEYWASLEANLPLDQHDADFLQLAVSMQIAIAQLRVAERKRKQKSES